MACYLAPSVSDSTAAVCVATSPVLAVPGVSTDPAAVPAYIPCVGSSRGLHGSSGGTASHPLCWRFQESPQIQQRYRLTSPVLAVPGVSTDPVVILPHFPCVGSSRGLHRSSSGTGSHPLCWQFQGSPRIQWWYCLTSPVLAVPGVSTDPAAVPAYIPCVGSSRGLHRSSSGTGSHPLCWWFQGSPQIQERYRLTSPVLAVPRVSTDPLVVLAHIPCVGGSRGLHRSSSGTGSHPLCWQFQGSARIHWWYWLTSPVLAVPGVSTDPAAVPAHIPCVGGSRGLHRSSSGTGSPPLCWQFHGSPRIHWWYWLTSPVLAVPGVCTDPAAVPAHIPCVGSSRGLHGSIGGTASLPLCWQFQGSPRIQQRYRLTSPVLAVPGVCTDPLVVLAHIPCVGSSRGLHGSSCGTGSHPLCWRFQGSPQIQQRYRLTSPVLAVPGVSTDPAAVLAHIPCVGSSRGLHGSSGGTASLPLCWQFQGSPQIQQRYRLTSPVLAVPGVSTDPAAVPAYIPCVGGSRGLHGSIGGTGSHPLCWRFQGSAQIHWWYWLTSPVLAVPGVCTDPLVVLAHIPCVGSSRGLHGSIGGTGSHPLCWQFQGSPRIQLQYRLTSPVLAVPGVSTDPAAVPADIPCVGSSRGLHRSSIGTGSHPLCWRFQGSPQIQQRYRLTSPVLAVPGVSTDPAAVLAHIPCVGGSRGLHRSIDGTGSHPLCWQFQGSPQIQQQYRLTSPVLAVPMVSKMSSY